MVQSNVSFYIFGMLYDNSKTGYDLFIHSKNNLPLFLQVSRSTLYYLLNHLTEEGFLSVKTIKDTRTKKFYSLTTKGKKEFYKILEEFAENIFFDFVGIVLLFINKLPIKIKKKIIQIRLDSYKKYCSALKNRNTNSKNSLNHLMFKRMQKIINYDKKLLKELF